MGSVPTLGPMPKLNRFPRVRIKRRQAFDAGLQLASSAALVYGLWQVWEPIAWIVGGAGGLLVSYANLGGDQ